MDVNTKMLLHKKFCDYYQRHTVPAPNEIEFREFGVGNLNTKIKVRHKSFRSERDMQAFLRREAPYYISYSAAYYEFPQNPIKDKRWKGAELIFDLDVPMKLLNSKKLQEVKDEALKLLQLLYEDFGIPKEKISVNFSGCKGYHIHVFDETVRTLGKDERREIVDYVTGKTDVRALLKFQGHTDEIYAGPKQGDVGWSGRIYKELHIFLSNATEKELQEIPKIGAKKAQTIIEKRQQILKALESGRYDLMPWLIDINRKKDGSIIDASSPIMTNLINHLAVHFSSESTDEMVTIDTSRLIRLPNTIHGGSGLIAKTVKELESFNPLIEAVAFGKEAMTLEVLEDVDVFEIGESKHGPFKIGERIELPEYAGMYLLLHWAPER